MRYWTKCIAGLTPSNRLSAKSESDSTGGGARSVFLMHALPRHCSAVWGEEEDFFASAASGADHSFAHAETQFSRSQVRNHDHQATDELLWCVGTRDPCEDVAADVATETERELHELVGTFDV